MVKIKFEIHLLLHNELRRVSQKIFSFNKVLSYEHLKAGEYSKYVNSFV